MLTLPRVSISLVLSHPSSRLYHKWFLMSKTFPAGNFMFAIACLLELLALAAA
jgi:hypothetical protein